VTSLRDGELETAVEMARALRRRGVSPLDLLERAMARAEAWQPSTNAFSQLWQEDAAEDARLVEVAARALATARHPAGGVRAVDAGEDLPATAGIPIAVKELFDVAGHETSGCSEAYRGSIAAHDAQVIRRVREAGLVIVGKTNQHELAAGGTNLVSACGRTGNPWDPARMTGGSSGGSAAAVAAGVVPWALGSDTGGSVRIPSSVCGTFGLKPATGRLPLDGIMPLAPSMDCPGPIAATAGDLAVLYGLMSGGRAVVEVPPPNDGPPELRVGMPGGFFAAPVHPETLEAVARTAEVLEGAGVPVEEVDGRGIEDSRRVWFDLCAYEFVRAHPIFDGRRELVAPSVVAWAEHGERQSAEDHHRAVRRRSEIAAWYRARLERFDALLVPTTPYPAPRADQLEVDLGPAGAVEVARVGPGWLCSSVNLSGLPAVSIPAGTSSEGLPIGVSLIGRDDGEDTLLGLAALWQRAAGYAPVRPPLPSLTIP